MLGRNIDHMISNMEATITCNTYNVQFELKAVKFSGGATAHLGENSGQRIFLMWVGEVKDLLTTLF